MKVMFRNAEGFTLLELLVALSIGVALVIASGVIIKSSVGLLAREEKWLRGDFRDASALEFLREQISAMRAGGATISLFVGKNEELNFVTPIALTVRGRCLVEAHYSVQKGGGDKYSLLYAEKRLTTARVAQGGKNSEGMVLLSGYDGVGFEYLEGVGADSKWMVEWSGGDFPRALRITLIRGKDERKLIVPIVATSFSLSSGQ